MRKTRFLASGIARGGPVNVVGAYSNPKKAVARRNARKRWSNPDGGERQLVAGERQNLPAKIQDIKEALPALGSVSLGYVLPRVFGLAVSQNIRAKIYNKLQKDGRTASEVAAESQMWLSLGSFGFFWWLTAFIPSQYNAQNERSFGAFADYVEKYRTFILAGHFGMTLHDFLNARVSREAGGWSAVARVILDLDPPSGITGRTIFDHMPRDGKKLKTDDKLRFIPESLKPQKGADASAKKDGKKGVKGVGDVNFDNRYALSADEPLFFVDSAPPSLDEYQPPQAAVSSIQQNNQDYIELSF